MSHIIDNITFYLAQLIGLLGLIILLFSFQKNTRKDLLKYQIISSSFFSIQYLILGALSGFVMNITMCIRNLIFSKYENVPKKYITIVVIIMIMLSLLSYNGPISLLPCLGSIMYTISLAKSNLKITRCVNILTCILYAIYDIKVLAIAGLISTTIELLSTLFAIYRYDLKVK